MNFAIEQRKDKVRLLKDGKAISSWKPLKEVAPTLTRVKLIDELVRVANAGQRVHMARLFFHFDVKGKS